MFQCVILYCPTSQHALLPDLAKARLGFFVQVDLSNNNIKTIPEELSTLLRLKVPDVIVTICEITLLMLPDL